MLEGRDVEERRQATRDCDEECRRKSSCILVISSISKPVQLKEQRNNVINIAEI